MRDAPDFVANTQELLLAAGRFGSDSAPDDAVPSPCVSVCRMEQGVCAGCLRTLDEIAAWSRADGATRRAIWRFVGDRAQARLRAAGASSLGADSSRL